jgi:hypothetical protein
MQATDLIAHSLKRVPRLKNFSTTPFVTFFAACFAASHTRGSQ